MRRRRPGRMVGGRRRARRDLLMPPFHETLVTSVRGATAANLPVAACEDAAMRQRVSSPAFAGRAGELELLGATLGRASAGSAAMVLVGGDAGIGKSRLVEEFCARARREGALIARGGCVPLDGAGLPYGPVVGFLRDLVRQSAGGVPATLLDPLGLGESGFGVAGAPAAPSSPTSWPRPSCSSRPRVPGDAGRSGRPSCIVVRGPAVGRLGQCRAARLPHPQPRDSAGARGGTYRSDELGRDHRLRPWLSELTRHPRVTTIALDGLARDEMAVMIEGILGQPAGLGDWSTRCGRARRATRSSPRSWRPPATAPRCRPSSAGVIMTRVEGRSPEAARRCCGRSPPPAPPSSTTARRRRRARCRRPRRRPGRDGRRAASSSSTRAGRATGSATSCCARRCTRRLLPGERRAPAPPARRRASPTGAASRPRRARPPCRRAGRPLVGGRRVGAGAGGLAWRPPTPPAPCGPSPRPSPTSSGRCPRCDRVAGGDPGRPPIGSSCWSGPPTSPTWPAPAQRSVDLARQAIDAPGRLGADRRTLARALRPAGPQRLGDRRLRQPPSTPTDRPRRSSRPTRRRWSWPGSWPRKPAGLMLMSRFAEAEERCPRALAVATAVGARAEEGHVLCTLGCCRGLAGPLRRRASTWCARRWRSPRTWPIPTTSTGPTAT